MVGREKNIEPLVLHDGAGSTGFVAYGKGAASGTGDEGVGVGVDHGVVVSEMSALTNELEGEGKVVRRGMA